MIKKIFATLTAWREKETDLAHKKFREKAAEESREAKERHDQIMESREQKYVSERTVPSDEEILGPSDSALKETSE